MLDQFHTHSHNLTRPPTRTHSLLSHALTNFHMHTLSSQRIGRWRIVFISSFVFFAFLTFISLGRSLFPICHCPSMTTNTLLVSIPLFTLDQSPSPPSLSLSLFLFSSHFRLYAFTRTLSVLTHDSLFLVPPSLSHLSFSSHPLFSHMHHLHTHPHVIFLRTEFFSILPPPHILTHFTFFSSFFRSQFQF